MLPGVPVTSISRNGDIARAFSPGRTQYVLAASGTDYSRTDGAQAYGLLVIDIASGSTTELRADRKRFRFAEPDDVDAAWINHHFMWQRDSAGREQLLPRERFAPWPWRAKLMHRNAGSWELRVPRIDAAFFPVLRRLLEREPGLQLTGTSAKPDEEQNFLLGGCALQARVYDVGGVFANGSFVTIFLQDSWPDAATAANCEATLRRLAVTINTELATGRHDALIKLD